MDAFFPAVVALDRRWRRFVGFVAHRGAPTPRPTMPPTSGAASPAPARWAPASSALAGPPGRRFRGPGYRPRSSERAPAAGDASATSPEPASAAVAVAESPTVVPPEPDPPLSESDAGVRLELEAFAPEAPATATDLAAGLDARRAQAAALRALLLARQRRYAEAESAFAQAAGIDRTLDLGALDGFWELERGAHQAAIRAYEAVGRHRDAMVMRATLDGRYRPRLVRTA